MIKYSEIGRELQTKCTKETTPDKWWGQARGL